MNCPACGAPMKLASGEDSFTCPYCHSVYFPEKNDDGVRLLGDSEEMCPVCAIQLKEAALDQVRLRYCERCRGMLISMDSFAALVDAVRAGTQGAVITAKADLDELKRKLTCPHCHRSMDSHFYAGPGKVIIADCEHCNLNWLDHGKLQRIAHAADPFHEG